MGGVANYHRLDKKGKAAADIQLGRKPAEEPKEDKKEKNK